MMCGSGSVCGRDITGAAPPVPWQGRPSSGDRQVAGPEKTRGDSFHVQNSFVISDFGFGGNAVRKISLASFSLHAAALP